MAVAEALGRQRKLEKKWTGEEGRIMVEMIGEREAIWNCCSSTYKNRDTRNKCWTEIADKTNHSVADVKIHWNTIKSRFNAERKKELMSINRQGAITYESKFELYKPLQFLLKVESRPPEGTTTNSVGKTKSCNNNVEDSPSSSRTPYTSGLSPVSLSYDSGEEDSTPILKKQKRTRISSPTAAPPQNLQRAALMNEISSFFKSQREVLAKNRWKKVFSEYIYYELDRYKDRDAQNLKNQITMVCLNFQPEGSAAAGDSQKFLPQPKTESEHLFEQDEYQDDAFD